MMCLGLICNCLSYFIQCNCEDHFHIHILSAVHSYTCMIFTYMYTSNYTKVLGLIPHTPKPHLRLRQHIFTCIQKLSSGQEAILPYTIPSLK